MNVKERECLCKGIGYVMCLIFAHIVRKFS